MQHRMSKYETVIKLRFLRKLGRFLVLISGLLGDFSIFNFSILVLFFLLILGEVYVLYQKNRMQIELGTKEIYLTF